MNVRRVLSAAVMVALLAATSCASNGGETAADTTGTTAATVPGGNAGVNGGQAGNATTTSTAATVATPSTVATALSASTASTATVPPPTYDPDTEFVLPEASNCSPGPGALPDGLYFGYLVTALDDSIQFDLACWFTGEPAAQAAAEDGGESPPPNDYWIRNANLTERTVPVAGPDLPVEWLFNVGNPDYEVITYNEWLIERGDGYAPPIWIIVDGGQLIAVVEQYLP